VIGFGFAVKDIFPDSGREEEGVLIHHRDLFAKGMAV
jgi:hypothetical protein